MNKGLVHVYTGDGKGKTSCAVGLAARAAGRGLRVVFAQFMKPEGSGERCALARLPGVRLMPVPATLGFVWTLNHDELRREAANCQEAFESAREAALNADVLILDEIIMAVSAGLFSESALIGYIESKPEPLELVLTGRGATDALIARADYVSIIECAKHPFNAGVPAREGIEF